MTTSPTTVAGARGKRRWLALLAGILVLAAAGVGGYFLWRPRIAPLPEIATEGLDAEVVAAIDRARNRVKAEPRSASAWGHLGMVLFAQDMYTPCSEAFAEAERLDPHNARWPYFAGLALMLEQPEKGIVLLERAAALPPPNFSIRLRLAEQYLKLQRLDEADALFRALLDQQRGNPRALLGRGQILSRRGRYPEALERLQAAAEHPTARHSGRVALAETYSRMGKTDRAEAARKAAAEAGADVDWPDEFLLEARSLRTGLQPRILRALSMMNEGKVSEAAALMEDVLRDHPDSAEAYLALGKVLIRANNLEQAEPVLRRALALDASLVEGHVLLGGIYMVREDYPKAERCYQRTVELKASHGLAHYLLGESRRKQGNKTGALTAYHAAVRYRPDLAVAHLELGALLLEEGKTADAIPHLETAVRLDGKNERARTLLKQARAKKKP